MKIKKLFLIKKQNYSLSILSKTKYSKIYVYNIICYPNLSEYVNQTFTKFMILC